MAPYFLSRGRHIQEDIPALVAAAQEQYPHVQCSVAEPIGEVARVSRIHAPCCLGSVRLPHMWQLAQIDLPSGGGRGSCWWMRYGREESVHAEKASRHCPPEHMSTVQQPLLDLKHPAGAVWAADRLLRPSRQLKSSHLLQIELRSCLCSPPYQYQTSVCMSTNCLCAGIDPLMVQLIQSRVTAVLSKDCPAVAAPVTVIVGATVAGS